MHLSERRLAAVLWAARRHSRRLRSPSSSGWHRLIGNLRRHELRLDARGLLAKVLVVRNTAEDARKARLDARQPFVGSALQRRGPKVLPRVGTEDGRRSKWRVARRGGQAARIQHHVRLFANSCGSLDAAVDDGRLGAPQHLHELRQRVERRVDGDRRVKEPQKLRIRRLEQRGRDDRLPKQRARPIHPMRRYAVIQRHVKHQSFAILHRPSVANLELNPQPGHCAKEAEKTLREEDNAVFVPRVDGGSAQTARHEAHRDPIRLPQSSC